MNEKQRRVWPVALAVGFVPLVAVGAVAGLGVLDRIDHAKAKATDIDPMYALAAVAGLEGALHEEGSLAIAASVGLIELTELEAATANTDAAIEELRTEIPFHEPASPMGSVLREVDDTLPTMLDVRGALLAAEAVEGSIADTYRTTLRSTRSASAVIAPQLIVPSSSGVALTAIDDGRRATGDAVFESTAVIFAGADPEGLGDALARATAAERSITETAPDAVAAEVLAALASPEASLAAEGSAGIAVGELPDLVAWSEATTAWVLAYGDVQTTEIETSLATLEATAKDAERAVYRYAIIAGALALVSAALAATVTARSLRRRQAGPQQGSATSPLPWLEPSPI